VLGSLPDMLRAPWVALTSRARVVAGAATGSREDVEFLAGLAEAGQFSPVVDRCYPFDEIADAHRYVDRGHKRGNAGIPAP
jgi:D-arabinose 1-dehydrogenase-like Zn-dependent alcohol dehydrogenase